MLNKKFLLSAPIFVLVLVLGVSALDTVHTPAKGSAERNAIMDGLRAEYKKMSGPDDRAFRGAITFNVTFLKVHNGWAWIYAEPQSTD
ncbi:MAG: hypothetical protein ACJ73D_07215, partial [Pyrinomonadaceae bacterium]